MELLLPRLGLIFWTLLAFGIVFFILAKYAWKPILKSLNDREKNISDAILSTEIVKKEMAELKNENEIKNNEKRTTLQRILLFDKIIEEEPMKNENLREVRFSITT